MTNETLHSIDFIEKDEYENEKYPEHVYNVTAKSHIPVPRVGDTVSAGWFEDEEGERQEHVHYNAMNTGDAEYVCSKEYIVRNVVRHYNQSKKTNDNGNVVEDRVEVGTKVIISEVDNE